MDIFASFLHLKVHKKETKWCNVVYLMFFACWSLSRVIWPLNFNMIFICLPLSAFLSCFCLLQIQDTLQHILRLVFPLAASYGHLFQSSTEVGFSIQGCHEFTWSDDKYLDIKHYTSENARYNSWCLKGTDITLL